MKVNTDNLNLPSGVFVNPNNKETFNRYIVDIKGLKPLSREEEVEMFKRIEATNDPIAIETICKHNLLFVVSVAKRYARTVGHSALTLEDLISEGNLGLHQAIQKFDYRTGNKFISFAIWQIKSLIRQSIQNNVKTIRMPANASTQLRRYSREEVITEKELERKPTAQEVHSNMLSKGLIRHKNETAEHFEELERLSKYETSLNSFVAYDSLTELAETIEGTELHPSETLLATEREELILAMLKSIPEEVQSYCYDHFGLQGNKPLTYREMAEKYDTSPQNIKNRMDKYLRKLKRLHTKNEHLFSN